MDRRTWLHSVLAIGLFGVPVATSPWVSVVSVQSGTEKKHSIDGRWSPEADRDLLQWHGFSVQESSDAA